MVNRAIEDFIEDLNINEDLIDIREEVDRELTNIYISVDAIDSDDVVENNLLNEIDTKSTDLVNYIDQFIKGPCDILYPYYDSRLVIDRCEQLYGIDMDTVNKVLQEVGVVLKGEVR